MPEESQGLRWTAFDVVKAMLAFLVSMQRIPAAVPVIHTALHKLSQKKSYRKYLESYCFDTRSFFPFSRDLQVDLANMELAGLLSTVNPDLTEYLLHDRLSATFERYTKPLFTKEELQDLKRMSEEFGGELSKVAA